MARAEECVDWFMSIERPDSTGSVSEQDCVSNGLCVGWPHQLPATGRSLASAGIEVFTVANMPL